MYNGAWDYPADLRGYTWGWLHEFHARRWSVRYASAGMPRVANGQRFDRRLLRNRGDVVEGELRYEEHGHPGAVRLLGYTNHANAGTYADAIAAGEKAHAIPDIVATRRNGTLKYGFGLNMEQELSRDVGVFGRLAWNDGKTESFAFTAIDRMLNAGTSVDGRKWHRSGDTVGSAVTIAGLSGVHARYLAQGGLDFLIGDGRLRYGTERVWESYYSAKLHDGFLVSIDAQRITDPAYNRDRGPVWAAALRLHMEIGKHP
jgi:carbohydrate-selective porin OprB